MTGLQEGVEPLCSQGRRLGARALAVSRDVVNGEGLRRSKVSSCWTGRPALGTGEGPAVQGGVVLGHFLQEDPLLGSQDPLSLPHLPAPASMDRGGVLMSRLLFPEPGLDFFS